MRGRSRLAAVAAAVALIGAGCGSDGDGQGGKDERTRGGPLKNRGSQFGTSIWVKPGKVQTFGWPLLTNEGKAEAVIDRISLQEPSPGLEVVGSFGILGRVQIGDHHEPWPPRAPKGHEVVPARGLRVAPGTSANLILGLRTAGPGRYTLRAVYVDYRVGEKRYRRRVRIAYALCVRASGPRDGETCDVELPDPAGTPDPDEAGR